MVDIDSGDIDLCEIVYLMVRINLPQNHNMFRQPNSKADEMKRQLPPSIPRVPDRFVTLESLDLDQLRLLARTERSDEYKAFADSDPYAKELENIRHQFNEVSRKVQRDCDESDNNTGNNDAIQQLNEKKAKYEALQREIKARNERYEELCEANDASARNARLNEFAELSRERCEEATEELMDGDMDAKQFHKEFVPARKLYHERMLKTMEAGR